MKIREFLKDVEPEKCGIFQFFNTAGKSVCPIGQAWEKSGGTKESLYPICSGGGRYGLDLIEYVYSIKFEVLETFMEAWDCWPSQNKDYKLRFETCIQMAEKVEQGLTS